MSLVVEAYAVGASGLAPKIKEADYRISEQIMNITDIKHCMKLSERVKACRIASGWSQVELAERASVSQQLIAKIELGKVTETKKIVQLARALGLPPEELLGNEAQATPRAFGKLIREKRKAHGMTQSRLADCIGVTKAAVSHWENGRVEGIDPIHLHWLTQTLFLSDDDLTLFRSRPKLEFPELPPLPQIEMEVIHRYAALPESVRVHVRGIIEALSTNRGDQHEQEAAEERGHGAAQQSKRAHVPDVRRFGNGEDHAEGGESANSQGGCGAGQGEGTAGAVTSAASAGIAEEAEEEENHQVTLRQKFDAWYASPRGELQFQQGMHYLGWAYVCYAEGYKQAAIDKREPQ